MTSFYAQAPRPSASTPQPDLLRRRPQRISATVPWGLYQRLQGRADLEGRSLSNLVAHLLEDAQQL